ncbi:MAG: TonB-dependent siderophore receptor [Rhizobacter sp.]
MSPVSSRGVARRLRVSQPRRTPLALMCGLIAASGLSAFDAAAQSAPVPASPASAPKEAPKDAAQEAVLAPVKVKARQDNASEGTGSYTAPKMSTATGLSLSIRETPQTVTVMTRDRMDDQGMSTLADVINNTPGMSVTTYSGPNRETYYSRGFEVSNLTFDGLPVTSGGGLTLRHDMAMYDRVEIVRGASGIQQGSGTPAAAVNFVRKRPTRDFQASLKGEYGSWDYRGGEFDVSGPLNESGSLRGRALVYGYDSNSFQDVVEYARHLFYVIGEADLTPDTTLTLSLAHQRNDSHSTWAGLPTAQDGSDLKLPRSTYLGNKWSYWDEKISSVYASLEHRLDSGWKAALATNQIAGKQRRYVNGIYLNTGTGGYDIGGNAGYGTDDRATYDVRVSGPFQLFGRKHELLIGAQHRTAKAAGEVAGYWGFPLASSIDIYNWTHDAPQPTPAVDFRPSNKESQQGVYVVSDWRLTDKLKLLAGLRLDWFKFSSADEVQDYPAATFTTYYDAYNYSRNLTKYAGLTYALDSHHSVYTSYTDIFQPQSARDINDKFLRPILGKNYELGVKGEYFDKTLNVSAAIFRVDEANRAMEAGVHPLPRTDSYYRAAGVVRSEGYDLEAQGAITPNWQVGGGFTYVSAKIHKDGDAAAIGQRLDTKLPTRQLKLMSSYRVGSTGLRFGGNVRWQNRVYHYDDWAGYDYSTEQKAYALFDAMVAYSPTPKLDIQFNVSNLFDKVYYREINTQPVEWGGNALYGEPRKMMLTARYKF